MLIIKGGRVIDPKSGTDAVMDVLVKDGTIAEVSAGGAEPWLAEAGNRGEEISVLDASGLAVAPGLIDVHVHFRDPG